MEWAGLIWGQMITKKEDRDMNQLLKGGLTLLFVFVVSNTAVADHWTSAADVVRASHRLDSAAAHFHHLLHDVDGVSHIANDAHRLASSARHLHDMVEGGASYNHVVHDYLELEDDFLHLRRQVQKDHTLHHMPHIRRDWRRVERAMHDLEYAMEYGDDDHGDDDEHGDHDEPIFFNRR